MRLIGRGVILIILSCLVIWQGHAFKDFLTSFWSATATSHLSKIESAEIRVAYVLKDHEWTTFTISTEAKHLKILTNAHLSASAPKPPEQIWKYSVHYQLLDDDGQILHEKTYYHRTRLTRYNSPKSSEPVPALLYLRDDILPVDTRLFRINLADIPGATRLRLRLARRDSSIQDAAARVYAPGIIPDHKLGYVWQRMTQDQKQSLIHGLVYPAELLRQAEKNNLLKNRWRVLGPQGIQGRDYHPLDLYIMTEVGEPIFPSEAPLGLLLTKQHRIMIPIPEGGQQLRLVFSPWPSSTEPATKSNIQLVWYGEKRGERSASTVDWRGDERQVDAFYPRGLLECITTGGEIALRVFALDGGTATDITPEATYLRTYAVSSTAAVEFDIAHLDDLPTPISVHARYLTATEPLTPVPFERRLRYEFLTASGQVAESGHLSIQAPLSLYDQVADREAQVNVSEPVRFFFTVPDSIKRLRLIEAKPESGDTILVSVSNRPADLVRRVRVPEDYATVQLDKHRQRAWFPIRPRDMSHLIETGKSILLTVQPRPPETNPDVVAGNYHWQDYHPEGAWLARHILVPRDLHKEPMRAEAIALLYRPISLDRQETLTFRGLYGLQAVEPHLIFLGNRSEPTRIQVLVDGQLHYEGAVYGRRGEIRLPPITVGKHEVRLIGPTDGTWMINYTDPGHKAFVKRLANRFDHPGLTFTYDRLSAVDETLSFRLHTPYGTTEPSWVRVHIDVPASGGLKPTSTWTFTERDYHIQPMLGESAPVLNTPRELVDAGQPFFLPLGPDLPAGRYRIRVVLDQGPPGYLTMAKLTPGHFEQRRFFREKVIRYARP